MAPKSSTIPTIKKSTPPLKQATLSFKSTKRGAVALSKSKTKAKVKTKPEPKAKSDFESEGEDEDAPIVVEDSASDDEEVVSVKKEVLDMQDEAGAYRNYYREVKAQMGWMPPIHSEGQTKIHHMLRVFDNTYEYGPCVGMTRMERWERAQALGLSPPVEVRDILFTEQGTKEADLIHPVFYGQVL